ncbi:MAG TPA: RsmG family class I SAM-dependent methyltransferase, partial [Bacteroidota bacterium]|nr:RsmG family class I SAM-dependent methyltransferase [Bacteroidota bacterium]
PDSQFVLIDSIQKKINAVNDILVNLKLPNVRAYVGRAEELNKKNEFHAKFDYVITRAVASTTDIIKWATPFLKQGSLTSLPAGAGQERGKGEVKAAGGELLSSGAILLLKGGDLTEEIQAAKIKCKPKSIEVHNLPSSPESAYLIEKKLVIIHP